MIDTHAHIDTEAFDADREEMLERAQSSGVESIIIPGIEVKDFDRVLNLADSYEYIYCGIGIHPHHSNEIKEVDFYRVESLCGNKNVVAVGEIGLDYYYDFSPVEVQHNVFKKQLGIAKSLDMPVIVHNREADNDIINILKAEQNGNLRGVLHCFSSPVETLNEAVDLGFHISFTGNITFKKSTLSEVVKAAPLDRILLETDSPYMTPVPKRGKRNEPSNVNYIAEKIAEIKNISIQEVISMTTGNAKKLFNLAILMIFLSFTLAFAQTENEYDEDYYDDGNPENDEFVEEYYHPYKKFLGFGPVIGFNTIVETYYYDIFDQDVSNEGIIAYGGSFCYSPMDILVVEAAYLYSKNEKIAKQWDFALNPNTHQFWELSTHWTPNPYGRINVYGTIGLTLIQNSYGSRDSLGNKFQLESDLMGINAGLGFYINIKTSAGLFVPTLSWVLNFQLGRSNALLPIDRDKVTGEPIFKDAEVSTFFSIPRFGLTYYPNF